jgi:hypothetical protein
MNVGQRKCRKCGLIKNHDAFYVNNTRLDKRDTTCKTCRSSKVMSMLNEKLKDKDFHEKEKERKRLCYHKYKKLKSVENIKSIEEYAMFCVESDRRKMPLLKYNDWINQFKL